MAASPRERKIVVPKINLEEVKNTTLVSTSSPSSPTALRKTSSVKYNCLCSPTTHAGSFRCRFHRNSGLTRSSISVGAKLSEYGSVGSDLAEMENKCTRSKLQT